MSEQCLVGRPAAPGLALGPVAVLRRESAQARRPGSLAQEAAALRTAIADASADVAALAARLDGDGADILAFQVSLLADEALCEPALAAIADGVPADRAWSAALDREIAGYAEADDHHFRARTADLVDLRDRVLAHLSGTARAAAATPPGAVLVADDLTPSRFLATDWSRGGAIALGAGSPSSHVAVLARARGVPMVVGLGAVPQACREALVDGTRGLVAFDPSATLREEFAERAAAAAATAAQEELLRFAPARMADGTLVTILVNVADPDELASCDPAMCDGVGLVRTEFLFRGDRALPDEERQLSVYRRILAWADGRPVTFRTLDAGGDKPIPGLTVDESNPFLGLRGIRLSLARPEVFRVQLRALARAACLGPAKVMLPMVTLPEELQRAAAMLDAEVAALAAAGIAARRPALGIMIEVPAAALSAAQFPAAFYSIGSNDLAQYTMAAARDSAAVAGLADAGHPAVIELIARTVAAGRRSGAEVSLCGDAAAEPALIPKLLATGLRVLSVAPVAVARIKAAVAMFDPRRQAQD